MLAIKPFVEPDNITTGFFSDWGRSCHSGSQRGAQYEHNMAGPAQPAVILAQMLAEMLAKHQCQMEAIQEQTRILEGLLARPEAEVQSPPPPHFSSLTLH